MSTRNTFLNSQIEFSKKTSNIRQLKRKITFNMDKNIIKGKEKNKTMEKDRDKNNNIDREKDNDKEDSIKVKKSKDKDKSISNTDIKYKMPKNKRKSFYFSNKNISNAYNINTINTVSKKNKFDNEGFDEKEKCSEKKKK
jgi:hypothetical protein